MPRSTRRREDRREEADLRQQERDKRTIKQQLALIKTRRGESLKEFTRLIMDESK